MCERDLFIAALAKGNPGERDAYLAEGKGWNVVAISSAELEMGGG